MRAQCAAPPSIAEVQADPIAVNSELGTYTNFVNLLGWSAIASPASQLPNGLPFGITLIAPAWREPDLVRWAQQLEAQAPLSAGVTGLHSKPTAALPAWQVPARGRPGIGRGGRPFARHAAEPVSCWPAAHAFGKPRTRHPTTACMRWQAPCPPNPVWHVAEDGGAIAVEVWDMPVANLGRFVAGVPAPLGNWRCACKTAAR